MSCPPLTRGVAAGGVLHPVLADHDGDVVVPEAEAAAPPLHAAPPLAVVADLAAEVSTGHRQLQTGTWGSA